MGNNRMSQNLNKTRIKVHKYTDSLAESLRDVERSQLKYSDLFYK